MSEMSDASNDKIVVVPQRSDVPLPPTPRSSPPPDPAPEPQAPAVADERRPSRGLAAGDDAFPSIVADDEDGEDELPPSYEISTLPRPSDAHVHITVRSNTSVSSLPSLAGNRSSINTQGYVLTAPMSHQTASSRHSAYHNDHDPITFYGVEDPWVRDMYSYTNGLGYKVACPCCCMADGCCFSNRHGCCFSDRGGCFFSDTEGCCFSDHRGWFCSDGGCFCSNGASTAALPRDERMPAMQSSVRPA